MAKGPQDCDRTTIEREREREREHLRQEATQQKDGTVRSDFHKIRLEIKNLIHSAKPFFYKKNTVIQTHKGRLEHHILLPHSQKSFRVTNFSYAYISKTTLGLGNDWPTGPDKKYKRFYWLREGE